MAIEKPETAVHVMLVNKRKDNIARNRAVLKCIVESVFCGRQCIGLRGDGEGPSYLEAELVVGNPGNFQALLNVVAEHDANLISAVQVINNFRRWTYSENIWKKHENIQSFEIYRLLKCFGPIKAKSVNLTLLKY